MIALLLVLAGAAPDCPIQLEDGTREARLEFVHERGATPEHRVADTMGSGLAWLDYDGDGWQDLYVVQSGLFPPPGTAEAADRLFRNQGDGTFTDVTARAGLADAAYGMGAFAADYNDDGAVDLLVTNWGGVILYRNQGDGTFRDATADLGLDAAGWFSAAAWADVDGDGLLDLYLTRYLDDSEDEKLFCGDVETGDRVHCSPLLYPGTTGFLLLNAGDGTFRDATAEAGLAEALGKGLGAIFVDIDQDNRIDLYVANDTVLNFLFRNLGDGRFEDLSVFAGTAFDAKGNPQGSMGLDAGDLDGDGLPDLTVTHFEGETNQYYRNLGSGLYEDLTIPSGFGRHLTQDVAFGLNSLDLEGDGDLDIFIANGHLDEKPKRYGIGYAQGDILLWNDGTGHFVERTCGSGFAEKHVGRGSAVADYDRDGDPDIAVSNSGGPLLLLRNDGSGANRVSVMLVGGPSNRHGIGARLVAQTPGGRALMRTVHAGSSYLSTSEPGVRFGLGAEERIERLTVFWPSGTVQTIEDLPAGGTLQVVEPTADRVER